MRFRLWSMLFALLAGAGLGLGYAWVLSPRPISDAEPGILRSEFKEQYRSLVAASYAATGNLPRARARLSVLGDTNPIDALNAQAQRMLASAQTFERADQIVVLASALQAEMSGAGPGDVPVSTAPLEFIDAGNTFTPTPPVHPTDLSILPSETLEFLATQTDFAAPPAILEATPGPTQTHTPPPGEPFVLTGQETVCDSNLPDGLLQVLVVDRSRRQLAGVEIVISWAGGKEQFFTGLKPELGNGYADYIMTPATAYTVRLARGSDIALGMTAPLCQSPDGAAFTGSIKLTFQQP